MKFLGFDDAVARLNCCYREDPCPGLMLQRSITAVEEIVSLEIEFKLHIAGVFRELLSQYNFGNLRVGWVSFGLGMNNADHLRDRNNRQCWWREHETIPDLLAVAETDGFTVFVSAGSDVVYAAMARTKKLEVIAQDLVLFLRAVIALALCDKVIVSEELVSQIRSFTDAERESRFWFG